MFPLCRIESHTHTHTQHTIVGEAIELTTLPYSRFLLPSSDSFRASGGAFISVSLGKESARPHCGQIWMGKWNNQVIWLSEPATLEKSERRNDRGRPSRKDGQTWSSLNGGVIQQVNNESKAFYLPAIACLLVAATIKPSQSQQGARENLDCTTSCANQL